MTDLALEHAEAIRDGLNRPVDVVGTSTDGSIAQQLAATTLTLCVDSCS